MPGSEHLSVKQFPPVSNPDATVLSQGELLKEVITGLRDARNKQRLKPRDEVKLYVLSEQQKIYERIQPILLRQINASSIAFTAETLGNTISVVIGKDKFFLQTATEIDTTHQRAELEKELEYLKGFLLSVEKKLSNERFVQNAKKEVVDMENKKKADAEQKIKLLEQSINELA